MLGQRIASQSEVIGAIMSVVVHVVGPRTWHVSLLPSRESGGHTQPEVIRAQGARCTAGDSGHRVGGESVLWTRGDQGHLMPR